MGFITTPITIDEARKLVMESDGEVVSASQEDYFNNRSWLQCAVKAEIRDDGITLHFELPNADFVEYCLVKDIY